MSTTDQINKIVNQLLDNLPDSFKHLSDEVRQNLRLALKSTLSKMNLVSREEFDAQVAVLQRTREKLTQLETQLQKIINQSTKDQSQNGSI